MSRLSWDSARGPLVCAGVACIALWLTFSGFQAHHSSDSLIPVLASMFRWTPFYWEQDRYGLLIPLFALPFRSPMAKFMVVTGLNCLAGLWAFLAVARVMAGRQGWVSAGLVALSLFLGWAPVSAQASILTPYQFFTTPLLLLSMGVVVSQSSLCARRPAVAWGVVGLLSCLACWVNMASPLLAGMLWVGQGSWRRAWRHWLPALGTLVVGFSITLSMVFIFDHSRVQFRFVPLAEWPHSLQQMAWHVWAATSVDGVSPLLVWVAAGAALTGWSWRSARADDAATDGAQPWATWGAVLFYALIVGVQRWTRQGDYHDRFWHPVLLVGIVLATAVCLRPLARRWRVALACVAGIFACCTLWQRFDAPSLQAPRRAIESSMGRHTEALLSAGITHIAGDYWSVWPAVFAANVTLYEQARVAGRAPQPMWGLTYRSEPTRALLLQQEPATWRIAVLPPSAAPVQLKSLGLPPVQLDHVEGDIGFGKLSPEPVLGLRGL